MTIEHNKSLRSYNTFAIDAKATHFCEITEVAQLRDALALEGYPAMFVLSGGSNILLTNDIDALVLHINIKGITLVAEEEEHVIVKAMAGENWHQFVLWTLERGFGGLENLSLIPGHCGTAPMQNIGAYGVELKDRFVACEAMEVATGSLKRFDREACRFGYRDSFFKQEGKGRYIITSISLRLTKRNHILDTTYGAIEAELAKKGIDRPEPVDISDAVIAIRRSKLPDPAQLGNSGSFFKNPVLGKEEFETFLGSHPEAPYYRLSEDAYKVPAGWLIEQCGFKGKRFGDAGVHRKQALVLVNHGNATGGEILDLAHRIMEEVADSFGIQIVPEVNIVG